MELQLSKDGKVLVLRSGRKNKMKEKLLDLIKKFNLHFEKLSKRERLLIAIPAILVIIFISYELLVIPTKEAFLAQELEYKKAEDNLDNLAIALERYVKLKNRLKDIEEQYREIETTESGSTLLEKLVLEKVNVPKGSFNITDGQPQLFGGNYEKTPYTVRFSTTDLPKLVAFFEELTHGKTPMILRRLDLRKRGDRVLDVEIEVSGIRRIS